MVSKIISNLNYQIMEKEPVRILTQFLCNGTKKHSEPHGERGYHLKYFFFLIFFNHIIILDLNDKIMEKEPVRVLTQDISMRWNQNNTENHIKKEDTTYFFSSFIFFFLFLFKVIIFKI